MHQVSLRRVAFVIGCLCGVVPFALSARAADKPKKEVASGANAETIERTLIDEPDYSVVAKYRTRVTFGSTNWIRIELKNKTDKPLKFDRLQFRMETKPVRIDTGLYHRGTGSYLHGPVAFQLFYTGRKYPIPSVPYTLPAGESRVDSECFSMRAAALLKVPPECGMKVPGKWFVEVIPTGGKAVYVKPDVAPLEFEWHVPDAAGLAAVREHCRKLVAAAKTEHWEREFRRTMLSDPRTSSTVTVADLIAGLRHSRGQTGWAFDLSEFAAAKFAGNADLTAAYRELLEAENLPTAHDLHNYPALWDPSFVRPLVAICAAYNTERKVALKLLDEHRADWKDNWQVAMLLSTGVRRGWHKILDVPPAKLADNMVPSWAHAVDDLSRTNNLEMIEVMRPGLDDKRRLPIGTSENSSSLVRGFRPLRVCDAALHGILNMLDGPVEPLYHKLGFYRKEGSSEDFAKLQKRFDDARDKLIADLKVRLEARDKQAAASEAKPKPD